MARELGLPITVHVGMGRLAGRWGMVKLLDNLGLLGSDTTFIHCCYFSDEEWRLVADSGGTVSIAPQVEMQMGHGWPPVARAIEAGLRPSLSIDVVTTVPGDMFTEMRCVFAGERHKLNAAAWETDTPVPATMLKARDLLQIATLNGAHVAGLEDRTGSLTPGKQADVVVIDGKGVATAPVIDPVATVVLCADTSNVDTVIIGGKIRKRDGKLLADWRGARRGVEASRDYLLQALEKRRAEQRVQ
jgi:cytosine/adenosine deaminase-related metal-dependent hydrolase